jgi:hypothetical protein
LLPPSLISHKNQLNGVDNIDKPTINSPNPVNTNCGVFDGVLVADVGDTNLGVDSAHLLDLTQVADGSGTEDNADSVHLFLQAPTHEGTASEQDSPTLVCAGAVSNQSSLEQMPPDQSLGADPGADVPAPGATTSWGSSTARHLNTTEALVAANDGVY